MNIMVNTKEEAEEAWEGIIQDITNGRQPNLQLMAELEVNWTHIIAPRIMEMQDKIAKFSVDAGLISQEDVDKAIKKRDEKIRANLNTEGVEE